jgi:membrane protease YdiL (CAAX protease family)
MNQFIKKYIKTALFFALIGLVGGFFVGIYTLDSYPLELKQQLITELANMGIKENLVSIFLGLITAIQSCLYGFILGLVGIYLAKITNLWKDERKIEKKALIVTIIISIIGGLAIIVPDLLYFNYHIEEVANSYQNKPTLVYLLAAITYGGVIEEVMLRLFAMSLVSFILFKLFNKKSKTPSTWLFIVANIVSSLLFAIGHLPATLLMLGDTPLIIARCIILNGCVGLLLGYLYRKYGLRYSMIAHAGCHLVSKLIWILFI